MTTILDGKKVRDARKEVLMAKIKEFTLGSGGVLPCLAIVQVGDRADSSTYINAKKKFAKEIGAEAVHTKFVETVSEENVLREIENLNNDPRVHGIIVQLPLPMTMDKDIILDSIFPEKDVDGLCAENSKKWLEGRADAIWPATTRGIAEILDASSISLEGKDVVVIGRSFLVGKPTAEMCLSRNATVTVCHSKTPDLIAATSQADVIIVAAGKPRLIGASHVKAGQTVIDVGTTPDPVTGKIVGDVDFDAVSKVLGDTGMISPVPGGVGPMTVLALFENLIDACYNAKNNK
jgi:methylenetetrahydrofolate dehydrogenase (NADP+)/methenyltetrahydrofolate cyclohydrolase